MLEKLLPFLMVGMFGVLVQPPISEVGFHAGLYTPETAGRASMIRMTVGATGYTGLGKRLGVDFGVAYKQGGITSECVITLTPGMESPRSPSCLPPGPGFGVEQVQRLHDYLDLSALGGVRIPVDDSIDVQFVLGPTWGMPIACLRKNLDDGTEQECPTDWLEADLRLVAGAGLRVRFSERVDVSVNYRYGVNLRELDLIGSEDAFVGIASSLVAGLSYRR